MTLGIISDTHDDMDAIRSAVEILNREGVSHVIHAGDITSPFTFEIFRELKADFVGIFGNNDGDKILLREKSGGRMYGQPHIFSLGGKKIVIVHEPDLTDALAESSHFDLVIYGHTHRSDVRKIKNTLIINPGKVARLHRGDATLAIVDTIRMDARIITL